MDRDSPSGHGVAGSRMHRQRSLLQNGLVVDTEASANSLHLHRSGIDTRHVRQRLPPARAHGLSWHLRGKEGGPRVIPPYGQQMNSQILLRKFNRLELPCGLQGKEFRDKSQRGMGQLRGMKKGGNAE